MATPSTNPASILHGIHVLDGGLATELEFLGAKIDGPLWSAHVLEDSPAIVLEAHRAFIAAGAQCIATCSYQVSRMGYREIGLPAERADAALVRSVELARQAAHESAHRVLVAASLGSYGAALHNGAEYHGNYDCSYSDLVAFHRERIAVLAALPASQAPDILAFETFPSLEEAEAVCEALRPWPHLQAWLSFTCRDNHTVAHGEPVRACAARLDTEPQIIALGVNCIPPSWTPSLLRELQSATAKPLLVYPNSGESWDASSRSWQGASDPVSFRTLARQLFASGAAMVGGCCRTRPAHIGQVAASTMQQ